MGKYIKENRVKNLFKTHLIKVILISIFVSIEVSKGIERPTKIGNKFIGVTDFYNIKEIESIKFPIEKEYNLVSINNLTTEELQKISNTYQSYKYLFVAEGVYNVYLNKLCQKIDFGDFLYYNCDGYELGENNKIRLLVYKELEKEENDSEFPFCQKRCYDSRKDLNPSYTWDYSMRNESKTYKIKKGFEIFGLIRPFGDGCFVSGNALKICITGSSIKFDFNHPTNNQTYSLSLNITKKHLNSFVFSISPDGMFAALRSHGENFVDQKYIDFEYLPIDKDDPKYSFDLKIDFTRLPSSTNNYENIWLYLNNGTGSIKPICSEQIGWCRYDNITIDTWEESFNGLSLIQLSIHTSNTIYDNLKAMSFFWSNENSLKELFVNNKGDLEIPDKSNLNRAGIYRVMGYNNDEYRSITQLVTKNNIQEEYVYKIDLDSLSPKKEGIFREEKDFPKDFYDSIKSNRNKNFIPISYIIGSWEDTKTSITLSQNQVLTDNGIYQLHSDLCPSGQVELYPKYEGQCFQYKMDAYCVDQTYNNLPQVKIGNNCYLRLNINPSICPNDGRSYSIIGPPQKDYMCVTKRLPSCPQGQILINGNCYELKDPVCGNGYTYIGNGLCLKTSRDYTNFNNYAGYANEVNCINGQKYSGIYYSKGRCSNTNPYTFATFYSDQSESCIWNVSYSTDCGCPGYGKQPPSQCYTSACPGGSWDNSRNKCLYYVSSGCNNSQTGYYDYVYDGYYCVAEKPAQCTEGNRLREPGSSWSGCYKYSEASARQGKSYPEVAGLTYCPSNMYYHNNRCYEQKGISCNSQYNNIEKIIIGSSNSYNEWTGKCWAKISDGCGKNSVYMRGEHTTNKSCMKLIRKYDFIKKENYAEFANSIANHFNKYYFNNNLNYRGSQVLKNSKGNNSINYLFWYDKDRSFCPLKNGTKCQIVAGDFSICGIDKSCAACGNAEENQEELSILAKKILKGRNGKNYALFDGKYSLLDLKNIKLPNSSSYPTQNELNIIEELFGKQSYWTKEVAENPWSSGINISLDSSTKEEASNINLSGSFIIGNIKGSISNLKDEEAFLEYIRFEDNKGKTYSLNSKNSLPLLQYTYYENNSISIKLEENIVISKVKIEGGNGQISFIILPAMERSLVLSVDESFNQFLNECVFTEDYNMLCTVDMVECKNNICPYGSSYPCLTYNGKKYCSRFNEKCLNMSDPKNLFIKEDETEGKNDVKEKQIENGKCNGNIYIFNGKDLRCRPPGTQTKGIDCCKKEKGWFGLVKCKQNEQILSKMRSTYLNKEYSQREANCKYIGSYCAEKWKGVGCVQKKKTFCCFSSPLARIIHEQGRPQLGISWGEPKNPNCRGFTIDEFQKIDFSKIDFSEWIDIIVSDAMNQFKGKINQTIENVKNSFQ